QMSPDDLADLISYIQRLGTAQDPGLTEASLRMGTLLPLKGPLAEMGQAVKAVLTAYVAEVNGRGGIYHRTIDLRIAESGETPAATRASLQRLIEEDQVFAMVGAFMAGADEAIAKQLEAEELPLVGPFTLFPQTNFPVNRYIFYLLSGLKEQA